MSKLVHLNKENLFEAEFSEIQTENRILPTYLFEEIEQELSNLIVSENEDQEETDGAFDLIRDIVDSIRSDIEGVIENKKLKRFLLVLTSLYTFT